MPAASPRTTPGKTVRRACVTRRTANRSAPATMPATRKTATAMVCSAALAAEDVSATRSARIAFTIESMPKVRTRPGRIRAIQSKRLNGTKGSSASFHAR